MRSACFTPAGRHPHAHTHTPCRQTAVTTVITVIALARGTVTVTVIVTVIVTAIVAGTERRVSSGTGAIAGPLIAALGPVRQSGAGHAATAVAALVDVTLTAPATVAVNGRAGVERAAVIAPTAGVRQTAITRRRSPRHPRASMVTRHRLRTW